MSNDIVQYQRLASGYVPGLSEAGVPAASAPPALGASFGAAASSAQLQNCLVVRPVALGIYDVIIGNGGAAPDGIGGTAEHSPPLTGVGGTIVPGVNRTGRVSVNVRSIMAANGALPTTAAGNGAINVAIYYGSELGAVPIYAGIDNSRVVRIILTTNLAQAAGVFFLADADFDFSIERVIDPSTEP